jgi:hypothetical protein
VFYVNLPIGAIALPLPARLVPSTPPGDRRDRHLDLVGVLLLGAGVLSLLLPLVTPENSHPGRLWPRARPRSAAVRHIAWWEIRLAREGPQPLLYPRLERTPGYAAGSGIGAAVGTAILASQMLGTGRDRPADALLASCGLMTPALVIARAELGR